MSGGGTNTVQNSDPWSGAQPYLRDVMGRGFTYADNPAGFYPGATYLGPTAGQVSGWDTQLDYADRVYGGARAPSYGEATDALSGALTGASPLGGLASGLAPFASTQLQAGFGGGAPAFNPSAYAPNLRTAGGFDTGAAFGRALSGTPDYGGLQASIDAANAPILREFEQDILPGLNQRATFLGNPTGGIKTLNRVLPEIGQRMSENAARITEGERVRALGEQTGAAQFLTGAGLQGTGLGLQGAGQAADIQNAYRNQLLGLGQLGGTLAGAQSDASLRGASLFPTLAATGAIPGQLQSQFADWGAGFQQRALQDQIDRWNYYQNLPLTTAQQYSGLVTGMGGLGGTTTMRGPGGSPIAGALGGAMTGATLASMFGGAGGAAAGAAGGASTGMGFGPWGALLGAGLGYLASR